MNRLPVIFYIGLLAVLGGCGKKGANKHQAHKGGSQSQPAKTATPKLIDDQIVEQAVRRELNLSRRELTKNDLEKIKELHLVGSELTEIPNSLKQLTQLAHLGLNSNKLKETGELEKFTHLTKLELANNALTNTKGLEKLTELKELHLSINKLTNAKGLEKLTQLNVLDLSNNELTDIMGLGELVLLEKLLLHENKLADVKELESLTQLKDLTLHNNQDLTKAQLKELQKALPNCNISHNFDMDP